MKIHIRIVNCRSVGFSVVELLVSVAVIVLMLVMLMQLSRHIQKNFSTTVAKTEQFRSARAALEAITWRLSQATLNTTWEYDNVNDPKSYLRGSDLRFEAGAADALLSGSSSQFPGHAVFFRLRVSCSEMQPTATTASPIHASKSCSTRWAFSWNLNRMRATALHFSEALCRRVCVIV